MKFRAAFVDFSCNFYDKHWVYSLGSCLLEKGIEVQYVNVRSFAKALKQIKAARPDLLLYSAYSFDIDTFIEFDRLVKQSLDVKSLLGGPGPTYDWHCHDGSTIDAVCIGEGEHALPEFVANGCSGGKNIVMRGESAPPGLLEWADLDSLPFPDRDIVYNVDRVVAVMNSRQFLSGRGCPYECSYCFNHAYNEMFKGCGEIVRKKSVDYLLAEIAGVKKKHPFAVVVFQDDTFIVDRRWFFEFCERFPDEVGLPYTCNIRANLMNEDVAKALKDSGCVAVNWSIESGNDHIRNDLLNRHMTREQILETGRVLNTCGIFHRIGNLVGLPGETYDQMLETLELNIAVAPSLGLANIFVPFPSLALTQYALDNGHLSPEACENLPRDFFTRSVMNIPESENVRIQKLMCLFPIFVRLPFLFRHSASRQALFALPRLVLRVLYEAFYVYMFASLYRVRSSWKAKVLMLARYIRNL